MAPYIKRFFDWIRLKEKIDNLLSNPPLFNEGEIWWVSVGENIGVEIGGKSKDFTRPVLIFKKLSRDGFFGFPTTTQKKKGSWYVTIKQHGKEVTVILSQARVFSSKRLYTKLGEIDDTDAKYVADQFVTLYLKENKKFPPSFDGVVGKSQI